MNRRRLITAATIAAAAAGAGGALSLHALRRDNQAYEQAVQALWRRAPDGTPGPSVLVRELVRHATLAPSSHNTQCWKFGGDEKSISIRPDFGRRCPVVDPDDHHLFVSLGCAAENLVQAAAAMGFRGDASFRDGPQEALDIALGTAKPVDSALFQAITRRQSTRAEFDGRPLSNEELKTLEIAGTGHGVRVLLLTGQQALENVLDHVVQGNTAQMRDPAFVRELKAWIRFNGAQAVDTGDGLFAKSSGNPAMPGWLGPRMFDLFFTEKAENDKYARHIRSSAGIAVFVSDADDKRHWIEAGRAFERFALQATALGVRTALLNQPVEVSRLRPRFAESLGIASGRPDLVVRFGRGPETPRSLRRPVDAVWA